MDPAPNNGVKRTVDPINSPLSLKDNFLAVLTELKALVNNHDMWGGMSLQVAAKDMQLLSVGSQAPLNDLTVKLEQTISSGKRLVAYDTLTAAEVCFLLRQTILSETFMTSIYVSSQNYFLQTNTHSKLLTRALSEFVHNLAERYEEVVYEALCERDEEEVAVELKNLLRSLRFKDMGAEEDISNMHPESILHFFSSMYDILVGKQLEFKAVITDWLKERKQHQSLCQNAFNALQRPIPTSDHITSTNNQVATETQTPSPVSTKKSPPTAPEHSLLDGIEGVDQIGRNDTNRGPVRSGNTGGERSDGRSEFFRNQDKRRADKEADQLKRMKAAGMNPTPGVTKYEQQRNSQLRRKRG